MVLNKLSISVITLFTFVGLTLPLIISYKQYRLSWDDTFFFHRAVCVYNGVRELKTTEIRTCLEGMNKSPLLSFMLVPFFFSNKSIPDIGSALVILTVMIILLALSCLSALIKLKIHPMLLISIAFVLSLQSNLYEYSGVFLSDLILSWAILLTLLYIPLELNRRKEHIGTSYWVLYSLQLSLTFNIGLMSKVTYLFFFVTVLPLLLFIRYSKHGLKALIVTLISLIVFMIPSELLWLKFGKSYLLHASNFSWGNLAKFYSSPTNSFYESMKLILLQSYIWTFFIGICSIVILTRFIKRKRINLALLTMFFILLCYLVLFSFSPNRNFRFLLPVIFSMPFVISFGVNTTYIYLIPRFYWILAILLAILFTLPMRNKIDDKSSPLIDEIFRIARQKNKTNIAIVTDSHDFNIEFFILTKLLKSQDFSKLRVNTPVYDYMHGMTLEKSINQLKNSDIIVVENPLPLDPSFTNIWSAHYHHLATTYYHFYPIKSEKLKIYIK